MTDIKSPRWLYVKGFLFLLGAMMASTLLLLESPSLKVAALLVLAIWCSARFYYFAFYVIEHYIDEDYKFTGLWSLVRYLIRRRNKRQDQ